MATTQVAILAVDTLGLPRSGASNTWVEDIEEYWSGKRADVEKNRINPAERCRETYSGHEPVQCAA